MFALLLNIVANHRLFKPYRTYAIATRPETTSKKCALGTKKLAMNPNRTFALKIPYRHSYAKLRRHTEQHMKVITGSIAFQQTNIFLSTQLANNFADRFAIFFKLFLFPVLWYNDNMILAFPFYMGLTLPIFHFGSPCPPGPSSGEPLYEKTHQTAEPYKFSPAEPVVDDLCFLDDQMGNLRLNVEIESP